jgi:hypothetical protein
MMRSDSPQPAVLLMSDLERDQLAIQEQRDMAEQLLDTIGSVLDGADDTLDHLENDSKLLPTAILRRCTEFADLVGGLASSLEQQTPDEQKQMAQAILQEEDRLRMHAMEEDVVTLEESLSNKSLSLLEDGSESSCVAGSLLEDSAIAVAAAADGPHSSDLKEQDIIQALSGAATLLRDVESAFREVGKDDAEEIADVALTLARLFLLSLQNIHSTLTPEHILSTDKFGHHSDRSSPRSTVVIEELCDPVDLVLDEEDDIDGFDRTVPKKTEQKTTFHSRRRRSSKHKVQQRVRVLWPPIGPQVQAAAGWTQEEAAKRPLLAVALGLTLWPVAISTALLGGTACLVDGFVQDVYKQFQDGPLIENLEQGAAQIYQAGRLTLVTSKLVGKQTLRIVQKQIDRQGGVGPVLEQLGHMTMDRITHPVETVGMVWNGVTWGFDRIKETVEHIMSIQQEGSAAQDLQQ